MVVRLLALRAGRLLPPVRFLVLFSVRGWVDSRVIVWLEGLDQLKNPMMSSGIKRDLPACNIVPQSTTPPCAPYKFINQGDIYSLNDECIIKSVTGCLHCCRKLPDTVIYGSRERSTTTTCWHLLPGGHGCCNTDTPEKITEWLHTSGGLPELKKEFVFT
jgi:hypothetical protein